MSNTSYEFYKNLPAVEKFTNIIDDKYYQALPEDWLVVITDVIGSTKAIEAGKYKEVNIAGGIAAMAIANVYKDLDFPFIFGGDGITFLIPGEAEELIKDILADTREVVGRSFELNLRVGFMSVKEIYANNLQLSLAKLKVSKYYNQANIAGEGLDWAEAKLKDRNADNPYLVPETHQPKVKADFRGFTCRWQDIPSTKGETLAMIIKITPKDTEEAKNALEKIFNILQNLLGEEENYHPLSMENLKVARGKYLDNEAKVQRRGKKGFFYHLKVLQLKIITWLTKQSINRQLNIGKKVNGIPIKRLQEAQIISSDFRKYDGTLKMVISLAKEDRVKLAQKLEEMYQNQSIFYGLHVSNRALMTCLLHTDSTREVHFIDAADGGYALAAKQLKAQITKAKQTPESY